MSQILKNRALQILLVLLMLCVCAASFAGIFAHAETADPASYTVTIKMNGGKRGTTAEENTDGNTHRTDDDYTATIPVNDTTKDFPNDVASEPVIADGKFQLTGAHVRDYLFPHNGTAQKNSTSNHGTLTQYDIPQKSADGAEEDFPALADGTVFNSRQLKALFVDSDKDGVLDEGESVYYRDDTIDLTVEANRTLTCLYDEDLTVKKHLGNFYHQVRLSDASAAMKAKDSFVPRDLSLLYCDVVSLGKYGDTSEMRNVFNNAVSVELPDTVTFIGGYVFQSATKLQKVSLPGVIQMGDYAFQGCSALKEVELSEYFYSGRKIDNNDNKQDNPYMLTVDAYLNTYAFASDANLQEIFFEGNGNLPVFRGSSTNLTPFVAGSRKSLTMYVRPAAYESIMTDVVLYGGDYTEKLQMPVRAHKVSGSGYNAKPTALADVAVFQYVTGTVESFADMEILKNKDGSEYEPCHIEWYSDKSFETKVEFPFTAEGTQRIYGKIIPNTFNITFHYNEEQGGENLNKDTTYVYAAEKVLNGARLAHYRFEGWYDAEERGNLVEKIPQEQFGDIELWARFSPMEYTVWLLTADGAYIDESCETEADKISYTWFEDCALPRLYFKEGDERVFEGWYLTEDFSGDPITTIAQGTMQREQAVYAKIIDNSTKIEYVLNGGTNHANNPDSYIKGEALILNAPTKEGYTFEGWYLNADFSGDSVTQISASQQGKVILYAKFSKNPVTFEIKYELNGGTNGEGNPATYTEGETLTLEEASKEGYVFKGWYTNRTFVGDPITKISADMTGTITLYAKFVQEEDVLPIPDPEPADPADPGQEPGTDPEPTKGGCNSSITISSVSISVAIMIAACTVVLAGKKDKSSK